MPCPHPCGTTDREGRTRGSDRSEERRGGEEGRGLCSSVRGTRGGWPGRTSAPPPLCQPCLALIRVEPRIAKVVLGVQNRTALGPLPLGSVVDIHVGRLGDLVVVFVHLLPHEHA